MKIKRLPILLIASIVASFTLLPAKSQTHSQAEEQAFRARQDEGSRLHQTYGEHSPQYQQWLQREKGGIAPQQQYPAYRVNPDYSDCQGNSGYRGYKKNKNKRHSDRSWHRYNDNRSNNWNWDAHNWSEQRDYLKNHWSRHDEQRMSALQRQQLDDQMRAQWIQYKQNRWHGNPTWNQYSDPGFLDYIHTRNPSLMQTLRTQIGF
ncbi:MAG: hypothetical protein K2W95_20810 [Candidatus Obscuribacterales bacterium]|nr:hypothetical protein [Candidatus Obscuribacterales bacterium]